MVDLKRNIYDKLSWLLTVFSISSFTVFESYSWGKALFLLAAVLIYSFYCVRTRRVVILIDHFQKLMALFILYTFISVIWSINASDTIEKGITLSLILASFSLMYVYYREENALYLLEAIKWSGYVVALYTISFFGLSIIFSSMSAIRLANTFSNVNSIGLICALACVIQFFEVLNYGISWSIPLVVPCIIVISATQSRKALAFLVLGAFAIVLLKNRVDRKPFRFMMAVIIGIIMIMLSYYWISNLTMFSGLYNRMKTLLYLINGTGQVDHSALIRNEMTKLGIKSWAKNPIIGNGIGTPHILVREYIGADHYMHNNYVELLCGGGIIGAGLYYAVYVYIIKSLLKYKYYDYKIYVFAIVWTILMLFMDFGMVSYYSKDQWFYLLTLCIIVRTMQYKRR